MKLALIGSCAFAATLCAGGAGVARAAEPQADLIAAATLTYADPAQSVAQPPAAADASQSTAAAPAPDAVLEGLSGGTQIAAAMSEQDLTAVSSGNRITADTVGSGAISMSNGALAGFGGIGNFVMNTGHNNVLQGAISVTIVVTN